MYLHSKKCNILVPEFKHFHMTKSLLIRTLQAFALFLSSISLVGQNCSDGGHDTTVCGYNIQLTGTPAPGTWRYVCRADTAPASIFNTNGKGIISVTKCGIYHFTYQGSGCTNTDTVEVNFLNPDHFITQINYDIALGYDKVECHESSPDTCGNRRLVKGQNPPLPQWDFTLFGTCTGTKTEALVNGFDSSTCLASGINLQQKPILSRGGCHWSPTQNVLVRLDNNLQVEQNIFVSFLQILTNSLENQFRDSCDINLSCPEYTKTCIDTFYDTVFLSIPVRIGGHWTFIGQGGAVGLDTSSDIIINSKPYHLYVKPSARYYGPDDIYFELWEDDNGRDINIDTALQADVYWVEDWIYDTIMRVIPRYKIHDGCLNCGFVDRAYGRMIIPPIPTTSCNTLLLSFTSTPQISIPKDTAICDGEILVLDPGPFTTYKWDNRITSRYRSVIDSGTYSVTVTSPNGCRDSADTHVAFASKPDITIHRLDSTSSICTGDAIQLKVTDLAKSKIMWSTGDTSRIITVSADNYNVHWVNVIDSNGCVGQDTFVFVGQSPRIDIDAGPDLALNCSVREVHPSIDSQTIALLYNFGWEGPGIDSSTSMDTLPAIDSSGQFILFALDTATGCLARDTIIVSLDTAHPAHIDFGPLALDCLTDSILLNARDSTIPGNALQWSGPGIDSTNKNASVLNVKDSGTYLLEICNPVNTCCTIDSFYVHSYHFMPEAKAGPDKSIGCMDSSIRIGDTTSVLSAHTEVHWEGDGLLPPTDTLPVSVNKGGEFVLTLIDTQSHCIDQDTVLVLASEIRPIADAGADQQLSCEHPTVELDGSQSQYAASAKLEWAGPDIKPSNRSQQRVTVSKAGTYILSIQDTISGCTSMDTVVVTGNVLLPRIDAGKDKIITCVIATTTLKGLVFNPNNKQKYHWSGPGITPKNQSQLQPEVSKEGKYYLTVTDTVSGCFALDSVEVIGIFNPATIQIKGDLSINCLKKSVRLIGEINDLHPKASFVWMGPGITPQNQNNLVVDVDSAGTYILKTKYPNAICNRSDSAIVSIDTTPPIFSVPDSVTIDCRTNAAIIELVANDSNEIKRLLWSTNHGFEYVKKPWKILVRQEDTANIYVLGTNQCSQTTRVIIKDWDHFDIELTGENSCPQTATGQIKVTTSPSNNAPYSYSLDSMTYQSSPVLSPLPAGFYRVFVKDKNGCILSKEIQLDSFPPIRLDIQTMTSCDDPPTGKIIITTRPKGQPVVSYTITNSMDSLTNVTGIFDSIPGDQTYRIMVRDTNECLSSGEVYVNEAANFTLAPRDTIYYCNEPYLVLEVDEEALPDDVHYNWGTSNDTLAKKTIPATDYEYAVTVSNSCNSQTKLFVILSDKLKIDTIGDLPLAFTPNGDNVNDKFGLILSPSATKQIVEYQLSVFNRWGKLIFESKDIEKRWDGMYNGKPLPMDTYLYVIQLTLNGCGSRPTQSKQFKGDVILIR